MFLVVLVAVIGAITAIPTKPGCCLPSQWEGIQVTLVGVVKAGTPSTINENVFVSYDEVNQLIAYHVQTDSEGKTQDLKIVQDYNKKVSFVADLKTQSCTSSPLTGPFQKMCLPAEAQPRGSFYYGIGSKTFPASSFSFNVSNSEITVITTSEDCVPISYILTNGDIGGEAQMQVNGFANLTPGIKDPTVFIPPSFCTQRKPVSFNTDFTKRGMFVFNQS